MHMSFVKSSSQRISVLSHFFFYIWYTLRYAGTWMTLKEGRKEGRSSVHCYIRELTETLPPFKTQKLNTSEGRVLYSDSVMNVEKNSTFLVWSWFGLSFFSSFSILPCLRFLNKSSSYTKDMIVHEFPNHPVTGSESTYYIQADKGSFVVKSRLR
ncbi:hypothetical protein EV361DRAFT_80183 [Lentinula raphanica]|nr:hypothetical protein EV361DRAFT_80183 [Lentinula raphanica]